MLLFFVFVCFFLQAEDGIRDLVRSRGLGDVYKRQVKSRILSKQAPILDHVGLRVRPEFLRAYLADPQKAKPGTTMPSLFADVSEANRDEQVLSLIHI